MGEATVAVLLVEGAEGGKRDCCQVMEDVWR
jgi:hypothetical protein